MLFKFARLKPIPAFLPTGGGGPPPAAKIGKPPKPLAAPATYAARVQAGLLGGVGIAGGAVSTAASAAVTARDKLRQGAKNERPLASG